MDNDFLFRSVVQCERDLRDAHVMLSHGNSAYAADWQFIVAIEEKTIALQPDLAAAGPMRPLNEEPGIEPEEK